MCKELLLIIEVDGISHEFAEIAAKDKIRQRRLEQVGFTVVRFTNDEVLTDIEGVYDSISHWVVERNIDKDKISHPLNPPTSGGH